MQNRIGRIAMGLAAGAALITGLMTSAHAATSEIRTSAFQYDSSGLLVKEVIEPGDSNFCLVTTYKYDAYGNKEKATTRNCGVSDADTTNVGTTGEAATPTGDAVFTSRTSTTAYASGSVVINSTTYNWSAGQYPTTSTNALNHSETKTYDPRFGAIKSLTGPNGLTTTWEYDNFGRKKTEIRSDGTKTEWSYAYCSGVNGGSATCPTYGVYVVTTTPLNSVDTANGAVSKVYYDSLNREIRAETQGFADNTFVYKDTQYDSLGRVYRVSRPYYSTTAANDVPWTTYADYDVLGRPKEVNEPAVDGKIVRTTTAYNGLSITVTVSNGSNGGSGLPEGVVQTKTTVKNSLGQTASITDTQGNVITYTYDHFGNLTATNAGDVTNSLTYDRRGRKKAMSDPSMGNWTYAYNALGELVRQCDPVSRGGASDCTDGTNGTATRMSYDKLGRMTERRERDLISNWYYDTLDGTSTGTACGASKGKLCKATSSNSYQRTHTYDTQGRLSQTVTNIDGNLTVAYDYNADGRLETTTYPVSPSYSTGFVTKNVYNARGYLEKVTNNANTLTYWQVTEMTASGRIKAETLGNGLTTFKDYDTLDRPTINQVNNGNTALQHYSYQYDTLGNMTQRMDWVQNPDLTETLTYDRLNRLTQSSGTGLATRAYTYSATGNILTHSGRGTYRYAAGGSCTPGSGGGPYAVKCIEGTVNGFANPAFNYDGNGNMTSGLGRTLTYTSYNMPSHVAGVRLSGGTSYTYDYVYNAEHERTKLVHSTLGTFIYLHPTGKGQLLYERQTYTNSPAKIEHKYYITAGGVAVAVHYARENPGTDPVTETRYLHHDHLGSVTLVTNEGGAEVERLAYEPFGKRRNPVGTDDSLNTILPYLDRGFTSHEHLDEIALIHMNGRVYDPVLGRFVTADPFLQDPGNLQSYNRYSYVLNNPLMYTDPSGYFSFKKVFKVAVAVAIAIYVPGMIETAYLNAATAGMAITQSTIVAIGATGQVLGAVGAGFLAGVVAGGSFESGVHGAISGGLFNLAAGVGAATSVERVLAHAAAGCVSSSIGDGRCGSGALSAGVAKFATGQLDGSRYLNDLGKGIAVTVIGGTASVLGGGKFENGATTAAFGYLFNACSQGRCWVTNEERALAQQGKFIEYWRAACDGGDSYACRAAEVSQGKGFWGRLATGRLTTYLINNGVIQSAAEAQPILDRIRADIVRADVGALDAAGAGNPVIRSREVINIYHENVFRQHGAPGAWGGRISDVFPGRGVYDYCPNCAR